MLVINYVVSQKGYLLYRKITFREWKKNKFVFIKYKRIGSNNVVISNKILYHIENKPYLKQDGIFIKRNYYKVRK